jgi:hypothetical protein
MALVDTTSTNLTDEQKKHLQYVDGRYLSLIQEGEALLGLHQEAADSEEEEDLTLKAKNAGTKSQVLDICSKAYLRCQQNGESFTLDPLAFGGRLQIKIQPSDYAYDEGKPQLVMITPIVETCYTPSDLNKAIEFLSIRFQ